MYVVIATSRKQYKVSEGNIIGVEKLGVEAGQTVTFDQVFTINNGEMTVGVSTVSGASVSAAVLREAKARKVVVYKYKTELDYRKRNGHRQFCTRVKTDKINV